VRLQCIIILYYYIALAVHSVLIVFIIFVAARGQGRSCHHIGIYIYNLILAVADNDDIIRYIMRVYPTMKACDCVYRRYKTPTV